MKNNKVVNPIVAYNVLGTMGDDTTEYQVGQSSSETVAVLVGTAQFQDDGSGNLEIKTGRMNGYYNNEEIDNIIEGLESSFDNKLEEFESSFDNKLDNLEDSFDSKLENYYTKEETFSAQEIQDEISSYVDTAIGGITSFDAEIVIELPPVGTKGTIYLKKDSSDDEGYVEYLYISGSWEVIGSTDIDIENYYTKNEVNEILSKKEDKRTKESYTIQVADWQDLNNSDPFKFSTFVVATYTIENNTEVSIINNQPILFANCGLVVGSVDGQNVIIYAIEKPADVIDLIIGYRG